MSNTNKYLYTEYKDLIEDLDENGIGLSKKSINFIASLLDDPPKYLSQAQVDWLETLERENL